MFLMVVPWKSWKKKVSFSCLVIEEDCGCFGEGSGVRSPFYNSVVLENVSQSSSTCNKTLLSHLFTVNNPAVCSCVVRVAVSTSRRVYWTIARIDVLAQWLPAVVTFTGINAFFVVFLAPHLSVFSLYARFFFSLHLLMVPHCTKWAWTNI